MAPFALEHDFDLTPLVGVCGVFVFLVLLLLAVLALVYRMLQPDRTDTDRPRSRRGRSGSRQIRVVEDGFWIKDPGLRRGSRVSYRCRTSSGTRTNTFEYYPGRDGHFVYTGEGPEDIEVAPVAPAGDSGSSDLGGMFDNDGGNLPTPQELASGADGGTTAPGDAGVSDATSTDVGGSFGEPPAY
jgi:hypothetical protein